MANEGRKEALKLLKEENSELLKNKSLTAEQVANYKATAQSIREGGDNLARWKALNEDILFNIDKISDSLDFIKKSFSDTLGEVKKVNTTVSLQKQGYKGIISIADKLLDVRRGEATLSDKEMDALREKKRQNIDLLARAKETLKPGDARIAQLEQEINDAEDLEDAFKAIEDRSAKTAKELGFIPKIAGGIDNLFSKIGLPSLGIDGIMEEVEKAGQRAASLGDESFNALTDFGDRFAGALKKSFTLVNLLQAGFLFLVNAVAGLDKKTGALAKNLGISYNESLKLQKEFKGIDSSSTNIFVTSGNINKAFMSINDSLGTTSSLSAETLENFIQLTEQAGYSAEAVNDINRLSILNNKTINDTSAEFLGQVEALNAQSGIQLNSKTLLNDINNISKATQLTLGLQADELARAAFQTKRFGFELSEVEGIANSLLDFEQSISAELEAELLTGKNLNLERARQAALEGDIATVAAEIANQVGSAAEFAEMNVIQQQALAESVGLSREELAKSLIEREALTKIGAKDAEEARKKYNTLRLTMSAEEAAKALGDERLAQQFESVSQQEKFTQVVEKLQGVFTQLAVPILQIAEVFTNIIEPVLTGVSLVVENIARGFSLIKENLEASIPAFAAIDLFMVKSEKSLIKQGIAQAGKLATKIKESIVSKQNLATETAAGVVTKKSALRGVADLAIGAARSVMATPIIGPLLAAAAAASAFVLGKKYLSKADDLVSPGSMAGYGNRVLSSPAGSIALNNKDTVIAGTNLGGGNSGAAETNKLLREIVTQNAKKPQISPVGLYEVQ